MIGLLREIPALVWYAILFACAWVWREVHGRHEETVVRRGRLGEPPVVYRVNLRTGRSRRVR
jgi:hypothetical protein